MQTSHLVTVKNYKILNTLLIKSTLIFFFWLHSSESTFCQSGFEFNKFPLDNQLYARLLSTNTGTIEIQGECDSSLFESIKYRLYKDNTLLYESIDTLIFVNGIANFNKNLTINSELSNYTVEVYSIDKYLNESLVKSADNIVAGDVYIIDGQSNAEARWRFGDSASAYSSNFIRVFSCGAPDSNLILSRLEWYIGDVDRGRTLPGNTGQWGAVLASRIIDEHQVPVAIFNHAEPGTTIDYQVNGIIDTIDDDSSALLKNMSKNDRLDFLLKNSRSKRNHSNPTDLSTDYGRLLYRLEKTNLKNKVRAIYYYQGEHDALHQLTTLEYFELWGQLYSDWMLDYTGVQKVFLNQIRLGCNVDKTKVVKIQEAQRSSALKYNKVHIVSAKGIPLLGETIFAKGCHYPFADGYEEIGNRMFNLTNKYLYGVSGEDNIETPLPEMAFYESASSNIVKLRLKNFGDTMDIHPGLESFFAFRNSSVQVDSVTFDGSLTLSLHLNNIADGLTHLTYYGIDGIGVTSPIIFNGNNIGLISFEDFPICQDFDSNGTCDECPDKIVDTGLVISDITLKADKYLESGAVIDRLLNVEYRAFYSIDLLPGFETMDHTVFLAQPSGCP